MDYTALIPYFVASTIFLVAPGPLMAVLIARSIARDTGGAAAFAAGLCFGILLVICAVLLGVGIWAEGKPELFSLAKYVGVAYLLWLAVGMWNDRSNIASTSGQKQGRLSSACAGILLSIGNPSVLLFYTLMLPSVAPARIKGFDHMALVIMVTCASAILVFFGTVLFAGQLKKTIASPGSSGVFSRVAAGVTALTSVWLLVA